MFFRIFIFIWRALGRTLFWLGWPAFWLFLRNTRRTRVVVRSGSDVLVVRGWLSDGRWSLPGGGLHAGEVAADGAARELFEETGILAAPAVLKPLGEAWVHHRGLGYHCSYFTLRADAEGLKPHRQLEILDVAWMTVADLTPENATADVFMALDRANPSANS